MESTLCWSNYSWAWSLTQTVVYMPRLIPLEKIGFPFPEIISANSFLVMGGTLCSILLFHAGNLSGLTLYLYVLSQSLWIHMCISHIVSERHTFLGVFYYVWLLECFHLLSHIDLQALRGGVWGWHPIYRWMF